MISLQLFLSFAGQMFIQMQPGQSVVSPDMPFGGCVLGMIESGDGYIDAVRAQVRDQRQLRPTV
ncbi:hypothetical protein BK664_20805 [Pseudomonas brassicacearum]|uniref:Uncharacterized protein n=1 Tax=Pseudomonas brassicacearum TaxID=930166 RepID=A0A423JC75_9PSED|nr:hypothetical protein BK664_20805 [Pseudomonas brassicacearum]